MSLYNKGYCWETATNRRAEQDTVVAQSMQKIMNIVRKNYLGAIRPFMDPEFFDLLYPELSKLWEGGIV